MFGTPERLAFGAEARAETAQQCVEQCPEASRREIQTTTGTTHAAKSPAFTATRPRNGSARGSSNQRRRSAPAEPLCGRGIRSSFNYSSIGQVKLGKKR
jgi:hypothetical protein